MMGQNGGHQDSLIKNGLNLESNECTAKFKQNMVEHRITKLYPIASCITDVL